MVVFTKTPWSAPGTSPRSCWSYFLLTCKVSAPTPLLALVRFACASTSFTIILQAVRCFCDQNNPFWQMPSPCWCINEAVIMQTKKGALEYHQANRQLESGIWQKTTWWFARQLQRSQSLDRFLGNAEEKPMLWSIWVPVTVGRKDILTAKYRLPERIKRSSECLVDRMVTKQKIRFIRNRSISRIKTLVQKGWSSPEYRSRIAGTYRSRKWYFKLREGIRRTHG